MNNSDTLDTGILSSHELGKAIFLEQLPIIAPGDRKAKPYRTHRVSKHLQIWLTEGRDYRSPNQMPDGPDKTLWGAEQFEWLKGTLLASKATFKILISPTPLVGPDGNEGAGDLDNHTNGYRHERKLFFDWLIENHFIERNFMLFLATGIGNIMPSIRPVLRNSLPARLWTAIRGLVLKLAHQNRQIPQGRSINYTYRQILPVDFYASRLKATMAALPFLLPITMNGAQCLMIIERN